MEETEFNYRKELLRIERENLDRAYENKLKVLKQQLKNSKMQHEMELERGRIKSAEIRKNLERKQRYQDGKKW